MSDADWIKNCTVKISGAIGGGSEMFTRHGEEFRLDVDFICGRIAAMRERQHNAMRRAITAERALAAKDAEIARLREVLKSARFYVEDAVRADGGIDSCEIHHRTTLELIDVTLKGDAA